MKLFILIITESRNKLLGIRGLALDCFNEYVNANLHVYLFSLDYDNNQNTRRIIYLMVSSND